MPDAVALDTAVQIAAAAVLLGHRIFASNFSAMTCIRRSFSSSVAFISA